MPLRLLKVFSKSQDLPPHEGVEAGGGGPHVGVVNGVAVYVLGISYINHLAKLTNRAGRFF